MNNRTCTECGASFSPRTGGQVCCSHECRAARQRRLDREYRRRARGSKDKRALKNDVEAERVQRMTFAEERKEKARRRAEFFAARDAAFERAGLPIPKIEERGGVRVEWRGQPRLGGCAVNHVMVSVK